MIGDDFYVVLDVYVAYGYAMTGAMISSTQFTYHLHADVLTEFVIDDRERTMVWTRKR